MKAVSPSSCISAVPRWAFQPLASRDLEANLAVIGQPVALAAQLFQFLRAESFL
jgi:hypothetical protein